MIAWLTSSSRRFDPKSSAVPQSPADQHEQNAGRTNGDEAKRNACGNGLNTDLPGVVSPPAKPIDDRMARATCLGRCAQFKIAVFENRDRPHLIGSDPVGKQAHLDVMRDRHAVECVAPCIRQIPCCHPGLLIDAGTWQVWRIGSISIGSRQHADHSSVRRVRDKASSSWSEGLPPPLFALGNPFDEAVRTGEGFRCHEENAIDVRDRRSALSF